MGPLIKNKLKKYKLSQVWLIDKLERRGFRVKPEELSVFLSGKKKTPKAESVISAAWDIILEYEKAEETTV